MDGGRSGFRTWLLRGTWFDTPPEVRNRRSFFFSPPVHVCIRGSLVLDTDCHASNMDIKSAVPGLGGVMSPLPTFLAPVTRPHVPAPPPCRWLLSGRRLRRYYGLMSALGTGVVLNN